MLQRKFFSSLFLLMALNLLIKPVWIFGIDRQVQNISGTAVYGNYFALFNLTVIFNFLLDIGITTFYNQQAAAGNNFIKEKFAQTGLLKLLLGILYGLLLMIIAFATGITDWYLLLLLAVNQFLFSLFLFLRSTITALQLFKTDAWLSVLDKLLMLIICGTLIYFPSVAGPIIINKFVLIQTVSVSVAIITTAAVILFHQKNIFNERFGIDVSLLKKALPFGIIVLLMSVHNRLDSFLLERIHSNGAYEAGIYARAFRLWDAANMVGVLMTGFLLPFAAKNFSAGVPIKNTVSICRNILLLFNIGVVAFCFLFATKLQAILYHTNDDYGAKIISLYLISLVGYALVQVYGTVLTATGNIKLFIKLTLPFMLVNAILNVLVVSQYGALACCVIAIVTQSLYGLAVFIAAKQKIAC